MKTLILLFLLLINTIVKAESITFIVTSRISLKRLEDVGLEENVYGHNITIDLDKDIFIDKDVSHLILFKDYHEKSNDSFYDIYYKHRKKDVFVTIMFPSDDDRIIIIVTDRKGNGSLYYCKVI